MDVATLKRKLAAVSNDYVSLCCSLVYEGEPDMHKHNKNNYIMEFGVGDTWNEVLDELLHTGTHSPSLPGKTDVVELSLAAKNSITVFHPHMDEAIEVAQNLDNTLKYATFKVIKSTTTTESESNPTSTSKRNAFSVLMSSATELSKFAKHKDATGQKFTEKDRMCNDVVDALAKDDVKFPATMSDAVIRKNVDAITNALWYVDGCLGQEKLVSRNKTEFGMLKSFLTTFTGYNDPKRKKQKVQMLSAESLRLHSSILFGVLASPYTAQWGKMKDTLSKFALCMSSYSDFLLKSNEEQKHRQRLDHPVREVAQHAFLQEVEAVDTVPNQYRQLDSILGQLGFYEYLYFDEEIHASVSFRNTFERLIFTRHIQLSFPINILRYDPGGSCSATIFLWKVSKDRGLSQVMNEAIKVVHHLKPRLPEYHTRRMRTDFVHRYCNLHDVTIPKHVLRAIYAETTLDATSDQNPAMDARVRQALLSEDSDLVLDMRHLNKGRPGDTFQVFYDILAAKVEEMCAADERRHNIEHMSAYISVRDLIEDVKKVLEPDTPIPSESSVLFAFAPKNAYLHTAKLYKSKVPLQFKIQTRQLRLSHQDDHYCAAQYKYMRHFAHQFRDHVTFLSIDDKSKIDLGEPGQHVTTGVRGKKSIVPAASQLSALDHDISSKGSITPSVCLNVAIPEERDGSFYTGSVTVTYKDAIFQASSPFRHVAEMQTMLQSRGQEVNPILMIFSDGGPDHRLTYHSVKLSLIVLFKNLDLDLLVAGRTAPGHSWLNPVERIMSTLNLAFQNAAIAREECDGDIEQVLRSANSMAEIRKKSEKVPALKPAWLESLQPIISVLRERTERLSLKGTPFQCRDASSDELVKAVEHQIRDDIDQQIMTGKYTQKDLSSKQDYQQFLKTHCIQRQYLFQIRKCENPTCCTPKRCPQTEIPAVPDPVLSQDKAHFKPLEAVIGQATTDEDRPSALNKTVAAVAEELQGTKNSQLTAQNVRRTVTCTDCRKPRCIYAKKQLSLRESRSLTRLLERHDYSCGALLTPDGDALQGMVFVKLQLACNTHIEFAYYATGFATRKDVCCHCAVDGVQRDANLLKQYRVVLPVCADCLLAGKDSVKRNPIKN
ncbi:uncharacterized protein LOC117333692 [Pecten maximus]|uniref:uncharacterized protein LOC117333692 n=1 Tax=Pecten maximus TaxID=6579 RepID=UPI001458CF37|nr:uncharacterized protein LOC117333692 [Pecten maximus]